ncbi:MAG: PAS/PAC sensor hybrid histidine kinase [Nitrospirae bacterium]|nr:MAG: PAS/PAC sensor hybrid histidine kinase [Nitrospirota bacterium]
MATENQSPAGHFTTRRLRFITAAVIVCVAAVVMIVADERHLLVMKGVLVLLAGAFGVLMLRRYSDGLRRVPEEHARELESSRAALRESEQRWQFALEGAGDGVWDWNAKTNEVYFSRQWKKMLGYEEHEIGCTLAEWDSRVHPEDRDTAYAEIGKHFSGQTPMYISEHRLRCKDGSYKWILDRGKIVSRDEDGTPLRVIGTHADITERKGMEMLLQKEMKFIDSVLNSIPGILYVYDEKDSIVRWNKKAEEMTGYTHEEISRMHALDWFKGDEGSIRLIAEKIRKVFKEGFADAEADLQRKDGTKIPMYFTAVSLTIAGNTYFTGIGIDISDRKKAEAEKEKLATQLQQAQKLESIGRLAGGIAHDFNNMLMVMFIAIELMKTKMPDDDPLLRHLLEIERAAIRSRDIIRQLLAFSRREIIIPRVVNLNEVIAETGKSFTRLIGEDIELRFLLTPDLRRIEVDPSQVEQMLINLVLNARDAMPDGGKLMIETANVDFDEAYCQQHEGFHPGKYVRLSVSDEGIGMDRETMEHIFEPFFTTKEVGKGTGLGLATMYGVVKQNAGFVNVYSEVGRGTTFKLYFPSADDSEQRPEQEDAAHAVTGTGTILLVEDDEMLCRATQTILKTLGYTVTAATSPAEALAIAGNSSSPYSLLMTDIVMPGMNGKQMSAKIAELHPDMKVLFMSGYSENVIVGRGVLDEGLNFIQKPISVKALALKIREVLST